MSLHDRIMAIDYQIRIGDVVKCTKHPESVICEAAEIATEADELMAEMVEFLQCCNFDNNTDMREADALVRKYKEQTK